MPRAEALYFIRSSRRSMVRRSSEYSRIQPTRGNMTSRGSTATLTEAGYAAGTRQPCSLTKQLQTVCDTAPMAMLRVGIDVSPLAQTRAGTARYLNELTAALEREPDVDLRRYGFGGAGRPVAALRDAVSAPFRREGPASEGDYVLAVSTLEPRKNLQMLADAFRRAKLDHCELRLVGARGWGGVEVNGDRVRYLGFVSDEELASLYRGARCVAYVSRYEGFGLPVLEALACGAAVVAADLPPIREFVDGAAITVDPADPDSIATGLEQAVARHDELSAQGPDAAAPYEWGRTAAETLAL